MKYETPVLTVLAPAACAVQSSQIKKNPLTQENFSPYEMATVAAYEADE